jgi:hypothetical protein
MKAKIKQIQHKMEHDPKFKEAVTRMKPKKNFWGIAGIVLFFFVPEFMVYIWQDELVSWSHLHSITEPIASQRWLFTKLEEMFISGVSSVNLILGSLFLLWVLKSK